MQFTANLKRRNSYKDSKRVVKVTSFRSSVGRGSNPLASEA